MQALYQLSCLPDPPPPVFVLFCVWPRLAHSLCSSCFNLQSTSCHILLLTPGLLIKMTAGLWLWRMGLLCVLQKGTLDTGQKPGLQFAFGKLNLFVPVSRTPQQEGHLAGLLGRASCGLHSCSLSWRLKGAAQAPFQRTQQGPFRVWARLCKHAHLGCCPEQGSGTPPQLAFCS